jgi:uncharacterized membrane protein YphA (DoxX/SURF4 family)
VPVSACNIRQIPWIACLLLVLLRFGIGWHLLYEGLWKIDSQTTENPWSSEGYLRNARGPFRDYFRSLIDDPDGLDKLDFQTMSARWDDWYSRFVAFYNLTDDQKRAIDVQLVGPGMFAAELAALPAGIDPNQLQKALARDAPPGTVLRYDANRKRLFTNTHLLPAERDNLLALVPSDMSEEAARPYRDAVQKLFDRSTARASWRQRLEWLLVADRERVSWNERSMVEGEAGEVRKGQVDVYKHLLARYEENLKKASTTFQHEHLDKQWTEIQQKRSELINPVDSLTREFQDAAYKVLTAEQRARGPLPEPHSKTRFIDESTMWGLTIIGGLMILGLFSRLSSLAAAFLLIQFYLPYPPWPGVPQVPGPEHNLIFNKVLVEAIACLALAALPTGRWIGVDAMLRRFVFFQKSD